MSTAQKEQITLQITGMSCNNCARHVQEGLERVEGVEEATVDLAHGKATVTIDPTKVKRDQLVSAVQDTGYGVAGE